MKTWFPPLALALGMISGLALAAYAGWIVRCRRGDSSEPLMKGAEAAALANGIGWLIAWELGPAPGQAAELAAMVSMAVAFTLIDVRIRVIPNELVAAMLCITFALTWTLRGPMALLGKLVGFLVALTLFLLAMWIAGPGKVGGGDVKLAAAVGFAAGFPDVLAAILAMALLVCLTGGVRILLQKAGRTAPLPFAGFLTGGLVLAMALDRLGVMGFMK
jgi:leader peptidase (prepilin peptidase)/N-methyltransferase